MTTPVPPDRPAGGPPESWAAGVLREAVGDSGKLFRVIAIIVAITACLGFLFGWLDWKKVAIVVGGGVVMMVCRTITKVAQSRAEQRRVSDASAEPAPRLPERDSGPEWNRSPRLH
ncbi:hypothetical protein O7626_24455 [Micromonospora sp. WMMD1102]|uniref:hypothetical protein n=1 Tax=Micromonospora sp. WMMD1102 TaxID=3016105 RepID=UPI00241591CE|nr:hypothetical protein [Micromonospora sp. WMMD1102]MDG4789043.1 hypothetical protein [Micromonospora sp. WMMD1102]